MTIPSLASLGRRLAAYPTLILGVLTMLVIGYTGWQIFEQWYDQPLPASSVAAQRIQLNNVQLQQLTTRLTAYHGASAATR